MVPKTYGWLVLQEKGKYFSVSGHYFVNMCMGVEANILTFFISVLITLPETQNFLW
jgi:hypothetical protein